jgi:hypothetical protein
MMIVNTIFKKIVFTRKKFGKLQNILLLFQSLIIQIVDWRIGSRFHFFRLILTDYISSSTN